MTIKSGLAGRTLCSIACVTPGAKTPDGALATDVIYRSMEKGVLMFAPVGVAGGTVKICPPLMINEEAMRESLQAFDEAFTEAVAAKRG